MVRRRGLAIGAAGLVPGILGALLANHLLAALLYQVSPTDGATLADLIARLSVLTDDLPELASIELNPVNAWTGGVDVLGAEVVISHALVRKDTGRRSLT